MQLRRNKKRAKKAKCNRSERVSIKKEGKIIETNTYIMHFNTPKILGKKKVGYTMERVK